MSEYPKLRPLSLRWSQWEGNDVLVLQDPQRLSENALMVPRPLTPFLDLIDGLRDLEAITAGFLLRTGIPIPPEQAESFVQALDDALLLENQRFFDAKREALEKYRRGSFRVPALAPGGYPEEQGMLGEALDAYCRNAQTNGASQDGVVGLISPHIDYARGWRTYARIWEPARAAVENAELVILLGTDHGGSVGTLTLTKQNYATPWGTLPTDTGLVDRLVEILGEERAFSEEVHHIGEHSIELAAVWLHYMAGGEPKRVLPVLCGHHEAALTVGDGADLGEDDFRPLWDALAMLHEVASEPKVLVVAAGDVSHVGPAFGDPVPLDLEAKAGIRASDHQWLEAA